MHASSPGMRASLWVEVIEEKRYAANGSHVPSPSIEISHATARSEPQSYSVPAAVRKVARGSLPDGKPKPQSLLSAPEFPSEQNVVTHGFHENVGRQAGPEAVAREARH